MVKESKKQLLAQGFKDLANIVAASLVIGQFISMETFDIGKLVLGVALSLLCYVLAMIWQP